MMPEPSTTAFLFPGQGSQVVGMGRSLAEAYPVAAETFAQADDLLGFPLSHLAFEGPESELNDTINTQPALFVHSVAVLLVFNQLHPGFSPALVAGHSMGELSALVAARAFDFEAGLRLVRRRGELMKQAGELSPGGMAAILGLDIPAVENICAAASKDTEVVQIANDNCPGQVVISGARAALERAVEGARQVGARRAVTLAVSIAAHSPLMAVAQSGFNQAIAETPISNPATPVIGNVTASPLVTIDQVRADLQAQLNARVRWTESIQAMLAQGVNTFIELGSESVLTGLLKRIDHGARGLAIGAPPDFEKLTAAS